MPPTATSPSVLIWFFVVLLACVAGAQLAPAAATSGQPAIQGRRIALIVGNGGFAISPLINPVHDAELIAKTLTSLGFEVQLATDSTQAQMKRAIQSFGAALEEGAFGMQCAEPLSFDNG